MTNWTRRFDRLMGELDQQLRGTARKVRGMFGEQPHELLAFRGYGNATTAWIQGRAVELRQLTPSAEGDSALRNLVNTYRRLDSDPLSGARLAVRWRGVTTGFVADDEGFFGGELSAPAPSASGGEWEPCELELLAPLRAGEPAVVTTGEILVPPGTARFGVISDIDDTVIQSSVSNFLLAARTVVLGNSRTRLPFPGVAGFYRALRDGATGSEANPVFYVSSSPWNIYDVIAEFMDLQRIPRGPILLRDWDVNFGALASARHFEHKSTAIRAILEMYPSLPFILIGDTTQHDPEIYARIVHDFPGRIRAIYIRDVTRSPERGASVAKLAEEVLAAHSSLVLAEDSIGAAAHAAEHGWIRPESLAEVREEKRADAGQTGEKVAAPDGGEAGTGAPATVIE